MAERSAVQDGQVEHIGTAPHPARNLAIMGGTLVLGLIIGLYYFMGGRDNQEGRIELEQFRQLMVTKCKSEGLAGPAHNDFVELYTRNTRMRAVVVEQRSVLERGQPDCEAVVRALKRADFPIQ